MKIRISLFQGIIFSFILMSACLVFSEEEATQKPATEEAPAEQEAQWIWGDVVSVDAAGRKVSVKYLDYETDTEKEINIEVNEKTAYENVKSIDEIKPLDTLSIDYIVSPDNRNIANNISVEKPEGAQILPEESIKEKPKEAPGLE